MIGLITYVHMIYGRAMKKINTGQMMNIQMAQLSHFMKLRMGKVMYK